MENLPDHINVVDRQVRELIADCKLCKSRAYFGEYDDPSRMDMLLVEWIARHAHKDWK